MINQFSTNHLIIGFLYAYVFCCGFVFVEPSPAELLTLIVFPLSLINSRFRISILLIVFALIVLEFVSISHGMIVFSKLNLRYSVITIYLIIIWLIFTTALHSNPTKDKQKILETIFKAFSIALFLNLTVYITLLLSGHSSIFGIPVIRFGYRFQGFFKDPNVLGPFAATVTLFWFHKTYTAKNCSLFTLSFLLLGLLSVLLSFSRAAWLNLLVGLLALVLAYLRKDLVVLKVTKRNIKLLTISCLVMILGLGLLSFLIYFGFDFFSYLKTRAQLQAYDSERFQAWKVVASLFERSPFLGVGPGNFDSFAGMSTHSLFVRILGEYGLLGLSGYSLFWVFHILKSNKEEPYIFASLCGVFANSIFVDTLHWRHFWILLAICWSMDLSSIHYPWKNDLANFKP